MLILPDKESYLGYDFSVMLLFNTQDDTYTPAIGYQMKSGQDVHRNTSTSNGHEIILHGISRSYKNGSGYAGLDISWDTY